MTVLNTMRVFFLVLLVFCAACASAQCPTYKYQFEFLAGYGRLGGDELSAQVIKATRGEDIVHSDETSSTGTVFASARYYLYGCLSIGMTAGYINEKGNNWGGYGYQPVVTGTYDRRILTVAFELYYVYKSRKYCDFYTFLGTGPSFTRFSNTAIPNIISAEAGTTSMRSDAFNFHYSPIGMRVGGRVGGFIELGYGYKGLISGGVSVRTGRPWWRY